MRGLVIARTALAVAVITFGGEVKAGNGMTATELYCETVKADAIQMRDKLPIAMDASVSLTKFEAEFENNRCEVGLAYLLNSSLTAKAVVQRNRKAGRAITEKMVRSYFATEEAVDQFKRAMAQKVSEERAELLGYERVVIDVDVESLGPMRSFSFAVESGG